MVKRIFLITVPVLLLLSLTPDLVLASACNPFNGLVPPPTGDDNTYTIADFFRLVAAIINFIIFCLVPPIAVLMLIIGGLVFLFAGGNPQTASLGKTILITTIIGLAIVYGSWIIIDTIIKALGYTGTWSQLPG